LEKSSERIAGRRARRLARAEAAPLCSSVHPPRPALVVLI
jgi:hypothetical protein